MSIELTDDQQSALETESEVPPRVVNPRTRETFVLVRSDAYDRMKSLLDNDGLEVAALVENAMAEDDAVDPLLPSYQKYRNSP